MLRILTMAVFAVTLCMAGVLYKIKYDTRSLQFETVQLRKKIALERQQLAVLKAEWSILTQPKRVEELAKTIGLKPLSPTQILSFKDLNDLPENSHVPFAALKTKTRAKPYDETAVTDYKDREDYSEIDRLISDVSLDMDEVSDAQ